MKLDTKLYSSLIDELTCKNVLYKVSGLLGVVVVVVPFCILIRQSGPFQLKALRCYLVHLKLMCMQSVSQSVLLVVVNDGAGFGSTLCSYN